MNLILIPRRGSCEFFKNISLFLFVLIFLAAHPTADIYSAPTSGAVDTSESRDLRVLLISSTVREGDILTAAAGDGILALPYDARTTTLEDLIVLVDEALDGRKAGSLGLVTHDFGEAKFYLTGSETVSLASSLHREEQRAFWRELGAMIAPGGRIDIFACSAASGRMGKALADVLEDISGVNVAASDDSTGNTLAGGDWILESDSVDLERTYFEPNKLAAFSGLLAALEKKLTASDAAANDEFGQVVIINGDYAIVGAPYNDDGGSSSGSAYIFYRNQGGTDNWGQQAKLTASDAAAGDEFGTSVSISGDYTIVGAPNDDDGGKDSGSAYIFARNLGGADNWGQLKKLTSSDAAKGDQFGTSVSVSGAYAIVGAPDEDDNGNNSGSAYVFSQNQGGADNWGQVKKITASDGSNGDQFGTSVSSSGNDAIVGSQCGDSAGTNSGSAYLFSRDQGGSDNWGQVKKLSASDGANGDQFGFSVALSGNFAVVGALNDDDNGSNSGSAYIFSRNSGGPNNWGQTKKLTASDGANSDQFGTSVFVSGDYLIIGTPEDDDKGNGSGSAYIFFRNQGGSDNWGEAVKLTASDGAANDAFGCSVSISGDYALIGAYGDGDAGGDSGSAYLDLLTTVVSSPTATDITTTSATLGATADNDGLPITERGVVWSTDPDPTLADNDGSATSVGTLGVFTVPATSLSSGTTYHYRGYATNSLGTSYTSDATFTTLVPTPPSIDSPVASNITETSATLGATVTAEGTSPVTERGVVWSTSANPTVAVNEGSGTSPGTTGIFTVNATGLSSGVTYHYRGYATNAVGTSYTDDATFTTSSMPSINNPVATDITDNTATLGATVAGEGSSPVTERGVVWSTSANPTFGSNEGSGTSPGTIGSFTVPATGLSPGTTYHYRGYATNEVGTSYTYDATFTTDILKGSLRVILNPKPACSAGAAWRLVGSSEWRTDGYIETGLPAGDYLIEFKPIEDWLTPERRSATVYANKRTSITVTYKKKQTEGWLIIEIITESAVAGGAKWRIKGDSDTNAVAKKPKKGGKGKWLKSEKEVSVTPGNYIIEFLPVPGWYHPEVKVTIGPGEKQIIEANYIPFLIADCSDYDGDGAGDPAVYRRADRSWHVLGLLDKTFGTKVSWPAPGDYDGDGVADLAHWSPVKAFWIIRGGLRLRKFGREGDLPVPADYDSDGKTDPALYRPSTGEWLIARSRTATVSAKIRIKTIVFGGDPDDLPVPGDYDGDGRAEPAVYNLKSKTWKIRGLEDIRYGRRGEIPVPADYDGDGLTDFAMVNLERGIWRVRGQFTAEVASRTTDIPVPGDYFGNGAVEIALYRCKNCRWLMDDEIISFGEEGDLPLVRGK